MGTCWNCNTQITLGEERTTCDCCGEILFYHCNSCGKRFEVQDKDTKKKLIECKLCGYFTCPNCSVCSSSCKKYKWEEEILKILQDTTLNQQQQAKKIREYLVEEKSGKEERVCPERRVLISYAKNRVKSLLAKVEGFRVKDEKDREAFVVRMNETIQKPIGTELKISEVKEAGSYGQEYRDAFNVLVCMGKLKIFTKSFTENDKIIYYDVYVRCDEPSCSFLSKEDLILNKCPNPKHIGKNSFSLEEEYCPTCPPLKKGKEKGQQRKLKKRLNDKDTCQLYRGNFIKKF